MRVQILADIHLEMGGRDDFTFPAAAPCLALLGDIGDPSQPQYAQFLLQQAARFDKVFVVAGNHESYGHSLSQTHQLIEAVCGQAPDRLVFLNCTRFDLDADHAVLGCTLWSQVAPDQSWDVGSSIADHQCIEGWDVSANNEQHAAERAWLQAELAIVLTHHAPTHRKTSAPQFAGSAVRSAFATDLEHMLRLPVTLWAYGHTHYSHDQRGAHP
ncbi:hypothetical protein WJX72_003578 [[Myrmecia] bisecta]|uniref:Calcineurin-like phosphoesterase domain-containing protein n=1 Tax=[Myrmecia] bisecta TaxID=41462 RepID=A0AAW1Q0Q4_9CHLO